MQDSWEGSKDVGVHQREAVALSREPLTGRTPKRHIVSEEKSLGPAID